MSNQAAKKKVKKETSHFGSSLAVVVLLLLASANIIWYFNKPKTQVLSESVNLIEEKDFWENIVTQNPSYFDGWIQLSNIEYQLGNNTAGETALNQARQIKPNSF